MSLIDKFPTLDPEIAALIAQTPFPNGTPSVEEERQGLEMAIAQMQKDVKDQLPPGKNLSLFRFRYSHSSTCAY